MKNLININATLLLFLYLVLLTSCEKSEETSYIIDEKEEDFMSTTGKSDSVVDENLLEIKKPVLHMSFGNDISKDEAYAKFDKVVEEYKRKNKDQNKVANTTWSYRIATKTGTRVNAQTDGAVGAIIWFKARRQIGSIGGPISVAVGNVLDNPGNDREGGWDLYLFTVSRNENINWVEIEKSIITLQGTDGWFLEAFEAYITPWDNPGSGLSTMQTKPFVWLDNTTSTGRDSFDTGLVGRGRLTFF